MKAVVYAAWVPLDSPDALADTTLPAPEPTGHDLLVEVHSVSVNPGFCGTDVPPGFGSASV